MCISLLKTEFERFWPDYAASFLRKRGKPTTFENITLNQLYEARAAKPQGGVTALSQQQRISFGVGQAVLTRDSGNSSK